MSTNHSSQAVLISGSSTGIGAACAMELDRRGFRVFAGVRNEAAAEHLRSLASPRLTPVMLDVTSAEMIAAVAEKIEQEMGERGLFGLVNNAGIAVSGPLELLLIESIRRQFEVNVLGHLAVTQAMLPMLRAAKGRVVNMSSVNGAMAPPYMGPYSASKFALEALTDALRLELRTWGIKVSAVEPGPIDTPIWIKSSEAAEQAADAVAEKDMYLYRAELEILKKKVARLAGGAQPVDSVVRAVVHALTAPRPKTRYFLRYPNRFLFRGFRIVPDVIRDWIILRAIGLS
jgi:NAD(P)-dependent dehydrogenase (short-subunit alcohol dehydrogenase family)